ncbi:MAG: TonB-dependent receptor, partial [Telluria sp.]
NGDRKREALNFALQWRPSSTVELFAEGFRTNIDHRFQNNFMLGFPPNFRGATITTKPGTNNLDTITLLNADHGGFTSTQAYQHDVINQQYAIGALWDVTPSVRVSTELATTKSDFAEHRVIFDMDYTARGFQGAVRSGGGYVDFPGTDMTDAVAANFRVAGGKDIVLNRGGKSVDWRSDVTWDTSDNKAFSFIKEVAGGVRLAERKAQSLANDADAWLNVGPNQGRNVSNFPGLASLVAPTDGRYGVDRYLVADRDYLLDNTAEVRRILTGSSDAKGIDPLSYFDDVEKTSAMYAKTKFAFHMGVPISGVLGARFVRTEQTLRGNSSLNGGAPQPVTVETTSSNVLPSLALKADFSPTLVGRVIAGKAIERPAFADYNPALRTGTPPTNPAVPGAGSAGNPYLRPTQSANVDVALEWYFASTGSLTGTLFRHNFTDRLSSQARLEVINGLNYNITRTYNLSKAYLEGAEVSYRQFYDGLPGVFKGFGMEANFTYMTGKQTNPDGNESVYTGLSKTSYNLVGLYERGDWSARLAYNWRSKFLAEERYRGYQDLNLYVAPMKTLDGSLTYRISKKLTVTLDGNNLLDQPYHDYFNQDTGLVRDTRRYDRAIGLALHYKY